MVVTFYVRVKVSIGFNARGEEVFRHFRLKSAVDVPDGAHLVEIDFISHSQITQLQFLRDRFKTEASYSAGKQLPSGITAIRAKFETSCTYKDVIEVSAINLMDVDMSKGLSPYGRLWVPADEDEYQQLQFFLQNEEYRVCLPCPFCGHFKINPEGWKNGEGRTGPACRGCGATAKSVKDWNRRSYVPEEETTRT